MESPVNVSSFLRSVLQVFTPSAVSLVLTGSKNGKNTIEKVSFHKTDNRIDPLKAFLYSKKFHEQSIKEIQIVTAPGTIRVANPMYDRKPVIKRNIFNLDIDVLKCIKPQELQQVIISDGKLNRNGINIKPLPLEELRKIWNEDSKCYRIPMPSSIPGFISGKLVRSPVLIQEWGYAVQPKQ